jgi:hypothetical protein
MDNSTAFRAPQICRMECFISRDNLCVRLKPEAAASSI